MYRSHVAFDGVSCLQKDSESWFIIRVPQWNGLLT